MRRGLILLLLFLSTCCSTVFSQQPVLPYDAPSKEEVMKFFEVMHVREQIDVMMKAAIVQVRQNVSAAIAKTDPNLSVDERKQMDSIVADMYNDIQKEFATNGMLEDIVPVYQRHLTRADLQAVVDFYQSPAGQRLIKEMPAMSVEAMQVTSGRSQKLMEDIMAKTKQRVDAMKAAEQEQK